jgi:hypothetical protein
MLKRLAVIVAGEYRTWDISHKYFFKTFAGRAEQIDYYFVTWDTTIASSRWNPTYRPVIDQDVTRYFDEQHRLVSFKIIPTESVARNHTYYLKAYLSKVGNILKREKEIQGDFIYDQVIDTRPDIYFRLDTYPTPFYPLQDLELSTADDSSMGNAVWINTSGYASIVDVYLRTNSFTHDLISARVLDARSQITKQFYNQILEGKTHHQLLAHHIMAHNIRASFGSDYLFYKPIRFNLSADVDLDQLSRQELHDLFIQVDAAPF